MHVSEFSFDWQVFVTTKFMFQAVQSRLLGDRRGMKSWRNHEEVAKKSSKKLRRQGRKSWRSLEEALSSGKKVLEKSRRREKSQKVLQ